MLADPELTDTASLPAKSAAPPRAPRSLEVAIMYFIGIVIIIIVTGFTVYRWQTGDIRAAIIDALIVAMVTGTLLMGNTEKFSSMALNLFGLTISTACLLSSLLVSSNGLQWAMLVLLVNAMTLSRRWALGLNSMIILAHAAAAGLYQSLLHQVSWTTVALLITGFALMMMDQLRQQRRQLAKLANLDPLTGAGNRRLMKKHLLEMISERRSGKRNGTLMVFDLDRFKDINDQYGHEAGDKVLQDFVRSVETSLRTDDGFYRLGGEEFVLLLRGMNDATARSYLPELHQRLSGQVSTPSGTVEFSAGAASLQESEDWSQWLARADTAMYDAKTSGRNRLSFSTD